MWPKMGNAVAVVVLYVQVSCRDELIGVDELQVRGRWGCS